ncbi:MAG: hypothetical protein KatS3mg104_3044 [Phycisphaerae bacterium]|nr:MAG: hypothetical protein KatS3mg104_3044 [Phycisphaerae bacterium]
MRWKQFLLEERTIYGILWIVLLSIFVLFIGYKLDYLWQVNYMFRG